MQSGSRTSGTGPSVRPEVAKPTAASLSWQRTFAAGCVKRLVVHSGEGFLCSSSSQAVPRRVREPNPEKAYGFHHLEC